MEEDLQQDQSTPNYNRQYEYAGFGRRLLAYFVDSILLFIVGLVIQYILGLDPFSFLAETQPLETRTSASQGLASLVSLTIGLIYFLIFWVNYDGATPGKKLMAIKIVRDDGSRITYPVAFVRYLGTFVSSFFLGSGYLWVIWDKKKQAWHDKIARTIVIKTNGKPKVFLALFILILSILFLGVVGYSAFKSAMQKVG